MQSVHLTLALFCHLLLASVVFYFTSSLPVDGSPLFSEANNAAGQAVKQAGPTKQMAESYQEPVKSPESPMVAAIQPSKSSQEAVKQPEPLKAAESHLEAKSSAAAAAPVAAQTKSVEAPAAPSPPAAAPAAAVKVQQSEPAQAAKAAPISEEKAAYATKEEPKQAAVSGRKTAELKESTKTAPPSPSSIGKREFSAKSAAAESILTKKDSDTVQPSTSEQKRPRKEVEAAAAPTSPLDTQQAAKPQPDLKQDKVVPGVPVVPQPAALVAGPVAAESAKVVEPAKVVEQAPVVKQQAPAAPQQPSVVTKESGPVEPSPAVVVLPTATAFAPPSPSAAQPEQPVVRSPALVMGGLGPLHLLATTLCSYQPDKSVADENLNQLYARRATVRKSLFDFMSLKFTNLEKLSSRLGYGLQVVPAAVAKSAADESKVMSPSHGWPVVGKCTAYDLKLMGEAAWCECQASDNCQSETPAGAAGPVAAAAAGVSASQQASESGSQVAAQEDKPAPITSNQHANRMMSARSIGGAPQASYSLLPSPEESSVISKILHVSDMKNAPLVESSIYNLNLTQHQLATLEAHATSTQECRRNALRFSKALFNHLAEDQTLVSDSWPKLYAAISADDCARKRMIDIVNALSGFRTDTTSIRRDNLEFAFAMDDLRAKVLENEVNVPLTFDRHFIEVEQFLQQSVRLMLANIQPKRAKLTSMRYRSLMYGSSSDEQCIDLHQRLLARNYPSDCNPTQFGQLPDVLRMTASSLELWSIEKELSMRMAKVVDYPNESPAGQQKVKEDVNECIANLVSS